MEFVKSPLNYTGGKFKLLPQIIELLPTEIDTFVDLFAGGGNVSVNVVAKRIIFNDTLWQVPEMVEEFKRLGVQECLDRIDGYIKRYSLSKDNKEGYLELRDTYNDEFLTQFRGQDPLMLYTLMCYSFNNQIRFNSKGFYNVPFGKGRSSFNDTLRDRFTVFVERLQELDIEFTENDFRKLNAKKLGSNDFVFCDPPYLVSTASYNENGGWSERDEMDVLLKLAEVDRQGVKFMLTNMFESKGNTNEFLRKWAVNYNVHYLDSTHSNCSYHRKDKESKEVEVLITNY